MTVSTRRAKVLTGINPQGIFGSFLGKQKGTHPAGQNSHPEKLLSASAAPTAAH